MTLHRLLAVLVVSYENVTLQYYEKTTNFKAHATRNVKVVVDLKVSDQPLLLLQTETSC